MRCGVRVLAGGVRCDIREVENLIGGEVSGRGRKAEHLRGFDEVIF